MLSALRLSLMLLCTALLAACQSTPTLKLYDGAERAPAELVTIRVPEQLELMTLNGNKVKGAGTLFSGGERELALLPGRYDILAYYKELWDNTVESHVVLRSAPVFFTVEGRAGEQFELGYPVPTNRDQAEKLADGFSGWSLNRGTGEKVPTRESGLERPNLIGNLISGGNTPAVAPTPDTPTDRNHYLDQLKTYWDEATPQERRAFREWIAQ